MPACAHRSSRTPSTRRCPAAGLGDDVTRRGRRREVVAARDHRPSDRLGVEQPPALRPRVVQDDLVFAGYDQDRWVALQHYQEARVGDLLTLWASFNRHWPG
jgi:hypothetical protein